MDQGRQFGRDRGFVAKGAQLGAIEAGKEVEAEGGADGAVGIGVSEQNSL